MTGAVVFILCSFSILFCFEGKSVRLDESFKMPCLAVDEKQIYIWDYTGFDGVSIYSKSDVKLLRKFGRKGQGPGEFNRIEDIGIYPSFLAISSTDKISFFSLEGNLQNERKKKPGLASCLPLGKNFVCRNWTAPGLENPEKAKNALLDVDLLDSQLNKKKTICRFEIQPIRRDPQTNRNEISLIHHCQKYVIDDNRLYVGDSQSGFLFLVFGDKGEKLCEIKRALEPLEIESSERKKMTDYFRESWGSRWRWWQSQFILVFPKYYPSFSDFVVQGGKIYVFLFPNFLRNEQKIQIFNLKGDLLNEKRIEVLSDPGNFEYHPYSVFSEDLYYLKSFEKTGGWEVHIAKLI